MTIKVHPRFALLANIPTAILPGGDEKRKAGKVTIKEKDLQAMAEDLCILLGIRFFRIPDKLLAFLAHFAPQWVRVFCSKYLAGVPDLMLFKRLPEGDNVVRFIEIKTEAGKLHQAQKKWHAGLNVLVCYGWEETERAIREFHTLPRKEPL
jgi:hypothetical protein